MVRSLSRVGLAAALLVAVTSTEVMAQSRPRAQRGLLPTLNTDQSLYSPETRAVLLGAGYEPGEFVTMSVVHLNSSGTWTTHTPWVISANSSGNFSTSWLVCEDGYGQTMFVRADGHSSGSHTQTSFSNTHDCGTGVVTSVVGVGGSCSDFTPAVGMGPDNYEVQEGGTYIMTIEGVTECTGDMITVFIQSSESGNFCFNAMGGNGTYSGMFTVPNPACNTMPVSYKCGADATCNHPGSFGASGPNSGCGGVHLRASFFDGMCNKTGTDDQCDSVVTGSCCLPDFTCVETTEDDCNSMGGTYNGDNTSCEDVNCMNTNFDCFMLTFDNDSADLALVHGQKVDSEFNCVAGNYPIVITGTLNGSGLNTAAILNSTTGPAGQDPDLLVSRGNILIMQNDANLSECPAGSGIYCSHNDDADGGTLSFAFCVAASPSSIVLIDIDGTDAASSVVLTDVLGRTRTFAVPGNWTGDRVTNAPEPGWKVLDLTDLAPQPGFASIVTASEDAGFDPTMVVQLDVNLGGSGAVDDLFWCQPQQ